MAKQVNARELLDENGEVYYPYTDISCVSGVPDDIAAFDIGQVEQDVANLQAIIDLIPVFDSTSWMTISLASGVTSFDSQTTPQIRLMTIGDVRLMSVRGSFKGLSSDNQIVGTIPSSIRWAVTKNVYFSQSMSTENGKAQFAAMKLDINGNISIEESTRSAVTSGTWLTCDWTFML